MPTDTPIKPRSRLPTSYPTEILRAVDLATRREVCIPFQSVAIARSFAKTLSDVRRSFREHRSRNWQAINSITLTEHTTVDVMASRPTYEADPLLYPVTCIMSAASGFLENLSLAQSSTNEVADPPPTTQLPDEAMEAELLALLSTTLPDDDDDTEQRIKSIFTRA